IQEENAKTKCEDEWRKDNQDKQQNEKCQMPTDRSIKLFLYSAFLPRFHRGRNIPSASEQMPASWSKGIMTFAIPALDPIREITLLLRMPSKRSAGLLMFRLRNNDVEVLLVHPGGPYFQNKDDGAWTIPKGEASD